MGKKPPHSHLIFFLIEIRLDLLNTNFMKEKVKVNNFLVEVNNIPMKGKVNYTINLLTPPHIKVKKIHLIIEVNDTPVNLNI